MEIKICVVGQGYVGLPLALSFAEYGYRVFGIDNSIEKVKKINLGQSPVEDIDNARLSKAIKEGSYTATTDYAILKGVNVFIVCVPTPLDGDHRSRVCIDFLLFSPGLRYESNCAIRATHRERIRRLTMHDRIEIDQKST